jgi:hypothetical protein
MPLRLGFDPGGFLKQLTAILGGGGVAGVESDSDESSGFYDDQSEEDVSDDASVDEVPAGHTASAAVGSGSGSRAGASQRLAAAAPRGTSGGRQQDDGPHTDTDSDDVEFMEE